MEDYTEGIILLFYLEEYVVKIQKWYVKILLKKQKNRIYSLFKTFEERIYKERKNILTKYEVAWGFNNTNCEGSRKFNQQIGYFFENVLDTSLFYNKIEKGICDGNNKNYYFECKNRYKVI